MKINEIVGYLPYRLKFDTNGYFSEFELTPIELDIDGFNDKGWKPILRPLKQLTEKIEIGGKSFIPLIEIAKLSEPYFDWFIQEGHAFSNLDQISYYEFWYDNLLQVFRFELIINCRSKSCITKYPNSHSQIECFKKLYEWHFDIHGLIEKNEAIDMSCL